MKKFLIAVPLVATLAACNGTTPSQGALTGAALGAATGAAVSGGDDKVQGAIIGGLAGAAAGNALLLYQTNPGQGIVMPAGKDALFRCHGAC